MRGWLIGRVVERWKSRLRCLAWLAACHLPHQSRLMPELSHTESNVTS
jgi:hypothetical protein